MEHGVASQGFKQNNMMFLELFKINRSITVIFLYWLTL